MNLTGLDPRVQSIYQPVLNQGLQDIQTSSLQAGQDMFAQLAKRGMLSSSLLPQAMTDLNKKTQEASGKLTAQIGGLAGEQSLALQEAQRQEQETKNWGLFNTALKFLSPLPNAIIGGIGTEIAENMFRPDYKDSGLNSLLGQDFSQSYSNYGLDLGVGKLDTGIGG